MPLRRNTTDIYNASCNGDHGKQISHNNKECCFFMLRITVFMTNNPILTGYFSTSYSVWKEKGIVLFNNTQNIFIYCYTASDMVKSHNESERGKLLSLLQQLLLSTSRMGVSYTPPQTDSTYHSLCYSNCETPAGMRSSSMGPKCRIDKVTHRNICGLC